MLLSDGVIRLVPLDTTHVDFVTAVRTDWRNYEFFFDFHLATREQELDWITRVGNDASQVNLVMLSDDDGGRAVGTISLTSIDRRSRHAEYGRLYVDPEFRRCGFARRASMLILQYAFDELNLRRVYLRVFSDNHSASDLYRGLGFEEEGCLRQHVYKNGVYRDVTLMGMFASDFRGSDPGRQVA